MEAKRLPDEAPACTPSEHHDSMRQNVRVNRRILAAWSGESAADDSEDDGPRGTESVTRIVPRG